MPPMNECEHRKVRIEASWGANALAHLICMQCGQAHKLSRDEVERYERLTKYETDVAGYYLALLLKEEDRNEEDPDVVHT